MGTVEEHLARWLAAGALDEAAAERIRAHERNAPTPGGRGWEGPGIMEALIYLGIAVAAVGVVILVGNSWEDLQPWARVAVVGVPGLLAVAAGTGLRTLPEQGMVRGGHIAWLAGAALLTGASGIAASQAGWNGDDARLLAAACGMVLSLGLWVLSPSHPQVVGIGAAMYLLSIALGEYPDVFSFPVSGISLAAMGAAAAALSERGVLRPQPAARTVAALAVAWGAYFAGMNGGWAESLVFVGGPALAVLSIWRGAFIYIIAGVAAIFVGLISTITRHVDDTTVASLLLILIGALLVGSVIVLARFRPWARPTAP